MKTFLITYHSPKEYRGTYQVKATDSDVAYNKVQDYLKEKFGDTKDSYSAIIEVEGGKIIKIK